MKHALILIAFAALSACTYESDLDAPPVDLGNFMLEHNVVVAPFVATASSLSREATEEELTTAVQDAIAARFDRYEGERRYHLGVSIEGYVLARAGIPVVAAPKSAMIIRVTVWDDEKASKLNDPPEQMTILENLDGESLIGTGWTQSAQKQLDGLARNAAKAIEEFLVKENIQKGWFMEEGYVPPVIENTVTEGGDR
ncbi:MAG: hypothetical protein AB8B62_08990 [Roseobacter sp.]